MKPSTPPCSRPSASASQRANRSSPPCVAGSYAGVMTTNPATRSGACEREPQQRVSAHRRSREHRSLDLARVEHSLEIATEIVVGVCLGRRRRRGPAVSACVVGDHAMARALERARAHHHVPPRRGETVQEDDRRPLPRLVARERDAGALDHDLGHDLQDGAPDTPSSPPPPITAGMVGEIDVNVRLSGETASLPSVTWTSPKAPSSRRSSTARIPCRWSSTSGRNGVDPVGSSDP